MAFPFNIDLSSVDLSKPMTLKSGKQLSSSSAAASTAAKQIVFERVHTRSQGAVSVEVEEEEHKERHKRKTFSKSEEEEVSPRRIFTKKVKIERPESSPVAAHVAQAVQPRLISAPKHKALQTAVRPIPRGFNMPYARASLNVASIVKRQFDEANAGQIPESELSAYLSDMERYGIRPNLRLCKIDDEVGHGIFLAHDAPPIKAGDFIGFYAGEFLVSHKDDPLDSDYLFTVFSDVELHKSEIDLLEGADQFETNEFYIEVDGKKKGNFLRYINHTSNENANLKSRYVLAKDGSIQIAIFAKKDIQPGQQAMLDYQHDYWKAKGIEPKIDTPDTFTLTRRDQIRRNNLADN